MNKKIVKVLLFSLCVGSVQVQANPFVYALGVFQRFVERPFTSPSGHATRTADVVYVGTVLIASAALCISIGHWFLKYTDPARAKKAK